MFEDLIGDIPLIRLNRVLLSGALLGCVSSPLVVVAVAVWALSGVPSPF